MNKVVKLLVLIIFLFSISCSNNSLLNVNNLTEENVAVEQTESNSGSDIPYNGSDSAIEVMLQAFKWLSKNGKNGTNWYTYLYNQRSTLKTYFDIIYMNPPSVSADGYGYMPSDWANLNSAYGSQSTLKSLISYFNSYGKKVIADIVVNHRSARAQCPHGVWCKYDYASFGMTSINFIHGPYDTVNDSGGKSCGTCMTSGYSEGSWSYGGRTYWNEDFTGSCDLNHWYSGTRTIVKNWLRWLKNTSNAGFHGWRWDMVGGYDPAYLGEYNDYSTPYLSVGEKPTGDTQALCDWVNRSGNKTMMFDFAMRDALYSAMVDYNHMYGNYLATATGENKNSGLVGWWSNAAVTFIHNHDIDLDHHSVGRNTFPWGGDYRGITTQCAYAFILTHPGIPAVFIQDWEDRGTDLRKTINNLIKIRKANNVGKWSRVWVDRREDGLYAAYIGVANGEQLAIKIGKQGWSNYENWRPNSSLGLTNAYTKYETGKHAFCVYYKNAVTLE